MPRGAAFLAEKLRLLISHEGGSGKLFACREFATGKADFSRDQCDRFTVQVVRRTGAFNVQVIFDAKHPQKSPDLIVDLPASDFRLRLQDLKSLAVWDHRDPYCLLNLLLELYKVYSALQMERAMSVKNAALEFYFGALPANSEFEVTKQAGQTKVILSIPIEVQRPSDEILGPDEYMHVLAEFTVANNDSVSVKSTTAKVFMGSSLMRKITAVGCKINAFASTMMILDYVEEVSTVMRAALAKYYQLRALRQAFVNALIISFNSKHLAEADTQDYYSVIFLNNTGKIPVLVTVRISDQFPEKQPIVILSAPFRYLTAEKPDEGVLEINDYPYSPRWTPAQIISRIEARLLTDLYRFVGGEKNVSLTTDNS